MEGQTLYSVAEVAEILHLSETTVRQRIRTGEIDAVIMGSGSHAPIRVPVGEVARFARRGIGRNAVAVAAAARHDDT